MSEATRPGSDSRASRTQVVSAALDLFLRQGFEQTSVDQIAQAAGISRSTFFRQFGGKDDVIFADHDVVLTAAKDELDASDGNPWERVCESSQQIYRHYAADPDLARRRYRIVREVPALRDREIVTASQYERLFTRFLRERVPGVDEAIAVAFSAAVTATHNHVLRQLLRGSKRIPVSALRDANDELLRRFGVLSQQDTAAPDDVVVAVFPRRMPAAELARRLREELTG